LRYIEHFFQNNLDKMAGQRDAKTALCDREQYSTISIWF
jgi:hypothetical protein